MPVLPVSRGGVREATLEDFESSAFNRYEAGLELITHPTSDYRSAGVYLMGYVAEMLLKSAYFRFKDNPPVPSGHVVDAAKRTAARAEAGRLSGLLGLPAVVEHDGYHSIEFWAFLVREYRRDQSHAWADPAFDLNFRSCVDRLHNNWRVSMRYYSDSSLTLDAISVAEDGTWLVTNYTSLWS